MAFDSFFSKKDKRIFEEDRPFVDREEYIQAFKDALESIRKKERSVLIYHGVAGIGKTSLRKELPKIIEEYNESKKNSRILWVTVNFETEEFRQPQKFLEIMRDQFLDNYGIKFYTFDIAHALYWSKINPRVPLDRENYSEDSIVTHALDIGDNLSSVYTGFGPAKLISDLRKLVTGFPEQYNEWASKNIEEISSLYYMEPSDIKKRLYLYWAYNLHEYLQKTSEAAVIFIDSYEALWGTDRSLSKLSSEDKWIRKLIQKLLSSPCLWVLCGQEFPRWEEYSETEKTLWGNSIERHKIGGLPEEDARNLLECCDVLEKDIQDTIISGSTGVPYYLDLSIDTYKSIKKIKKPEPDDFAKVPTELFERFIKYLDENNEAAIKVLSVPNFWNRDIFKALIKEFTNYPLNGLSTIHNFSFIDEDEIEEAKWSMHQLMRQSWQDYQEEKEPEERKSVHAFMFNYYENKLKNLDIKKITQEHKIALIEAYYHAKKSLETEDLLNWFIAASYSFNRAAFWQLIAPMYEEMLRIQKAKLEPKQSDVATILNNLALLYRQMGNYEKALPLYQSALEKYEKALGPEHPDVATTLDNLALLYESMGNYEKALPLYQRAFDIREQVLGSQHPDVATTLNNLAGLYRHMGNYKKALSLYQKDLEISEMALGPENPDVATTLNNLAGLYLQMGDYEKALPLSQRALEINEKGLGPQHPHVATTLNILSGIYRHMGDYEKALPLSQRALEINEKGLGPQHPFVAATLNNLAGIYRHMGDYVKALPLSQRDLEISEMVLGPEHPDVATTLNNLAGLYHEIGDYEKALPLYKRALDINEKVLGPQHPDVETILNNLAGLYLQMGDYEKASSLYQRIGESSNNPR